MFNYLIKIIPRFSNTLFHYDWSGPRIPITWDWTIKRVGLPGADEADVADEAGYGREGGGLWTRKTLAELRLGVGLRLALLQLWTSSVPSFVTFKHWQGSDVAGVAGVTGAPARQSCATGCAKDSDSILLQCRLLLHLLPPTPPTWLQKDVNVLSCLCRPIAFEIQVVIRSSIHPLIPPFIHSFIHSFIHPSIHSFVRAPPHRIFS